MYPTIKRMNKCTFTSQYNRKTFNLQFIGQHNYENWQETNTNKLSMLTYQGE
jgi:hypothetical protein